MMVIRRFSQYKSVTVVHLYQYCQDDQAVVPGGGDVVHGGAHSVG